jgi:hypothetical protein
MMRYITAILLLSSSLAYARAPSSPVVRESPPASRDSSFDDGFVSGFSKACVSTQLKKPSKLLSENVVRKICDCSARESFDLLNAQDVELMVGGKMPKVVQQKFDKALDVCIQRIFPGSE